MIYAINGITQNPDKKETKKKEEEKKWSVKKESDARNCCLKCRMLGLFVELLEKTNFFFALVCACVFFKFLCELH